MKKVLNLAFALLLYSGLAIAHEPVANSEFLTEIVRLRQNNAFPVERVTITYVRHCDESFSNVWLKDVSPSYKELGVTVRRTAESCTMDQPEWVYERVSVQVNSEVPTTYGRLQSLDLAAPMSGVSVDNFD